MRWFDQHMKLFVVLVLVLVVRSGESVALRLRDWRWTRAAGRSRDKA